VPARNRANNAVIRLNEAGALAARIAPASAPVHLVIDVTGWFE
jgi:hypothetical protein